VSKYVVQGLPEFNEFTVNEEEFEVNEDRENIVLNLKREFARFCILRIFRPDLLVDQVKRIVSIYFDETFVNEGRASYVEIKDQMTKLDINLLLVSGNNDAQNEIIRMKQVIRVMKPLIYKNLNENNLKKFPRQLAEAAIRGDWLMFDNIMQAEKYFP
jgi:Leucine-rich repeat (LRR) protein